MGPTKSSFRFVSAKVKQVFKKKKFFMKNFQKIENVIFDLGGVLFGLDMMATVKAFENKGVKNAMEKFSEINSSEFFYLFEIGKIPPEEFRKKMNAVFNVNLSDKDFDYCWNAMITHYPKENYEFLENMTKRYKIFILSNTNKIHVDYFEPIASWRDGLFSKRYYSNEIGFRKPDLECFEFVVNDAKIDKEKTIFIDDRPDNVFGAQKAGLQAIRLEHQQDLYKIFD